MSQRSHSDFHSLLCHVKQLRQLSPSYSFMWLRWLNKNAAKGADPDLWPEKKVHTNVKPITGFLFRATNRLNRSSCLQVIHWPQHRQQEERFHAYVLLIWNCSGINKPWTGFESLSACCNQNKVCRMKTISFLKWRGIVLPCFNCGWSCMLKHLRLGHPNQEVLVINKHSAFKADNSSLWFFFLFPVLRLIN